MTQKHHGSVRNRIVIRIFLMIFILLMASVVFFYVHMYRTYGATCYTMEQLQTDSRCLYVYTGRVYEKGTRASPHHGNACGSDVTSIIPSFHYLSMAQYLDPNYVGDICIAPTLTPTPSDTPTPTVTPTTTGCSMKSQGDADCNGRITVTDYAMWRNEFIAGAGTASDFNSNGHADLTDYSIWRTSFLIAP